MMGVFIPELVDYFNTTLATIKVDGTPITVSYAKPDISMAPDLETRLPEINFRNYDIRDDKSRYESDILLTETINNTLYTKPVAIPYNLYFQFILAAKYEDDIVQMETQFTTLFPPRAVITVNDPSVNDTYSLDMFLLQYQVADTNALATPRYGQVPDRLMRRLYRYYVRTEQDIYQWTQTPGGNNTVNPSVKPSLN